MINEKFVVYGLKTKCQADIASGELTLNSVAFIEDTKEIWAQGVFYGGVEALNVINNLTSTSITDALSAAQGKVLNDTKAALTTVLTKTNTTAFVPTTDYHPSTKKYVDDKVAAIPTPDVTAQIATHNTASTAHTDIRTAIGTKVDKVTGKVLSSEDYTTVEKTKLAGIATSANNYTHPTYTAKAADLYNVTVDATGHVSVATSVVKADITALGIPAQDTTYAAVTTAANGLMIAADKVKLNDIEAGAQVNDVTTVAGRTGAVVLTKNDVGLTSVDNTSDATKVVASAAKLTAAKTVTLTGAVTGNVSTDMSANVTLPTVLTGFDAAKITSGTISIDRLPKGAIERIVIVADDTARFALTIALAQEGDTVKVNSTGRMYFIVDDTKLNVEAGYEAYTATAATSVPWSGISSKPTTVSGYGITDAVLTSDARLTNSRPASDVSAWAKAATKPTYTAAEVSALAIGGTAVAATKLATPRTISGMAFDGTANITLTKSNVGLTNVDNTADIAKPISTPTQTALNSKINIVASANTMVPTFNATGQLISSGKTITDLSIPGPQGTQGIQGIPGPTGTTGAKGEKGDPGINATTTAIATTTTDGLMDNAMVVKLNGIATGAQVNTVASVAGKTGTVTLAKADVGLSNADNTTDLLKPISTATQTALNGKLGTTATAAAATKLATARTINGTSFDGTSNIEVGTPFVDLDEFLTLLDGSHHTITVEQVAKISDACTKHVPQVYIGGIYLPVSYDITATKCSIIFSTTNNTNQGIDTLYSTITVTIESRDFIGVVNNIKLYTNKNEFFYLNGSGMYSDPLSFYNSYNTVGTLTDLPITARTIRAYPETATNISLVSPLPEGSELLIRCVPIASFIQPIPNTDMWTSMSGTSITTTANKPFEISIWCYKTENYSIVVKEQD